MSTASVSRRQGLHWLGAAVAGTALPALAQTAAAAPGAKRLVSLSGALTEVVYLLNAQNLLVGTDTTSLFPEAAQKTAKVGYVRQLSAEGLLSLKPDAVIATSEAGPPVVLDQIRQAGVRVSLVAARHNWAEVQEKVKVVGRETGRSSEADKLLALKLEGSVG